MAFSPRITMFTAYVLCAARCERSLNGASSGAVPGRGAACGVTVCPHPIQRMMLSPSLGDLLASCERRREETV